MLGGFIDRQSCIADRFIDSRFLWIQRISILSGFINSRVV